MERQKIEHPICDNRTATCLLALATQNTDKLSQSEDGGKNTLLLLRNLLAVHNVVVEINYWKKHHGIRHIPAVHEKFIWGQV